MSKCISREGEYGEHELTTTGVPPFTCGRCWVFDEDAALEALERARDIAVALEQQLARVEALADHWHAEYVERGYDDQLYTSGVVAMLGAALEVDQ